MDVSLNALRASWLVLSFAALVLGGAGCSSGGKASGTGEGGSGAGASGSSGAGAGTASSTGAGGASSSAGAGASSSSAGAGASSSSAGTGASSSSTGGCTDACTSGAERCAGAQVQQCVMQGGCLDWSTPADCPTNQTCLGNQCVLACSDQCISGDTQCNAGQIQTCALQTNGCTNWNPAQACPSGETCSGGQCSGTCTNQCTLGATECSGPELQTCALQTNDCTDWNPAQACPNHGTCSAGVCSAGCMDACTAGATQCSGAQIETCALQTSGCTDWNPAQACPGTQTCDNGQCSAAACTPGALQCNGTVLQVCSASSTWATQQVCSQACDATKMACTTTTTCTAETPRCSGNEAEVCNSTGTAWLGVATCGSGCTNGLCTGACTPGATRCNGTIPETCNAGGTAWTQGTACTTSCIAGGCSQPTLDINANANATIGGVTYIDGDVSITNSSVLTVPSGTAVIYCNNFTLDASSQIVVAPTGNDPRGAGGPGSANGTCAVAGCVATAHVGGGGGSYGLAGTNSSVGSDCYSTLYEEYVECTVSSGPGAPYAIADNEAAPGAAGGSCPGGTAGQGGGLLAIYCNNIQVVGTITANGQAASGLCAGGGSGGGVVLRATGDLTFTGSISVAGGAGAATGNGYPAGGSGGDGVVKLLYGNTDTLTGTVIGNASFKSFMPPVDVGSATHPNPARWYNDNFPSFDLAWSQPFTNAAGFYYVLNGAYGFVPAPANAIFLGGEAYSYPPSALVAGTNYFHVDTVGPFANVGTVEARLPVNVNATPVTIASSSHPSSTTWYNNTSPYFTWTLPHAAADVSNFYWVFDPFTNTIPDTTANLIAMNVTTPQNSEQLLLPNQADGIWFFHVMAQDTMGYLTKQAAHFRVQIGSQPMQGSVSGSVTDATTHNPIAGVTVTLNRGVQSTTTIANGTYAFPSTVFDQVYEARASMTGYADAVQMVTVTGTSTTTANFQMSP
jgi:CarboxypepD_reg-like domain